jgi:hypothetical protein
MAPSQLTDLELSCKHPPEQAINVKMVDGRREVVHHGERVFDSWSDLLGRDSHHDPRLYAFHGRRDLFDHRQV